MRRCSHEVVAITDRIAMAGIARTYERAAEVGIHLDLRDGLPGLA